MKLLKYIKLINKKINSANKKAKNPFFKANSSYNPFNQPMANTLVWLEPDENYPKRTKD